MKHFVTNIIFLSLFVIGCSSKSDNENLKVAKTINNFYYEDNIDKKELDINNLDKYSKILTINNNEIKNEISCEILEDIAYINISYFSENISEKLKNIILNLPKNIKGLIINLENNLGGSFEESIKTVDLFVDEGLIVTKENKQGKFQYFATKEKTITKLPLVILVNEKTASSAEIVSGSLQYLKRVKLFGKETFGKRSVQALIYLNEDYSKALKITTAKFELMQKKIIPDIETNNSFNEAMKYFKSIDKIN